MPFEIVRNDITKMYVDAIVNTANPRPVVGYGVDTGIHQAAGPKLLEARKRIGNIPPGGAQITSGFELPAKYVIHAVGPVWQGGGYGEEQLLRMCYERSLKLAEWYRCRSIAFPLMAAGNNGFPRDLAMRIAMNAISDFLLRSEMMVYLVVFDRDSFRLSEKLQREVSSFIDEHYIQEIRLKQYGIGDEYADYGAEQERILRQQIRRRRMEEELQESSCCYDVIPAPRMEECLPQQVQKKAVPLFKPKPSLAELLEETDAGFSETLLKLIDKTGKKDSEIYLKANVSRQHFSKIRKNPAYKPNKATAIAFAIALELDLDETQELLASAGLTLSRSFVFDRIIRYFIQKKIYDIFAINEALFEFDQTLLGV